MSAELRRLAGLDHDADQRWAAEIHCFLDRALQVLRALHIEALAPKGVYHPVVAGAVDQRGLMLNIGVSGTSGMPGTMRA
jgi:hypothetical protein